MSDWWEPDSVIASQGLRSGAVTPIEAAALGGYPVILADPPWSYSDRGCIGAVAEQYATLSLEQICSMPVAQLASRDCVLFLWATYPKIQDALAVINAWGFTYKSIAFQWLKLYSGGEPFFGLGRWTRGNTEPVLLATRGKPSRVGRDVSQLVGIDAFMDEELVAACVGSHSAKPPQVRTKIERLMGECSRLELFARERVDGWDAWGNQIESDIKMVVE